MSRSLEEFLLDNLAQRLWSKSIEQGDCILWLGGRAGKGYGVIFWEGKQIYVHRLIYQIHNPDEILDVIRHTCDTPNCWNIDHLCNGTTQDNVDDKVKKLRHIFGKDNYNAKFKDEDIIAIRNSELNLYELAAKYNVTPSNIHYIRARKTWMHVQ